MTTMNITARSRRLATLRAASPAAHSSPGSLTIDAANGTVEGVALARIGPAEGWGFDIDSITLNQFVALAQAAGELRMRFGHPPLKRETGPDGRIQESIVDDIGMTAGWVSDVYLDGDTARGTIHLGEFATELPAAGGANVRDYVLKVAQDAPQLLSMSAVFSYHTEAQMDGYGNIVGNAARLDSLEAIDIVGKGAAVDNGLLAARVMTDATAPNVAESGFDPQPPSGSVIDPSEAGWDDPSGQNVGRAPTPADTIEVPAIGDPAINRLYAHIQRAAAKAGGRGACRFAGMSAEELARLDYMAAQGYTVCHQRDGNGGVYGLGSRAAQCVPPARMAARTFNRFDSGTFDVDDPMQVNVVKDGEAARRNTALDLAASAIMQNLLGGGAVAVELPASYTGPIPAAAVAADAAAQSPQGMPPVYGDPGVVISPLDDLSDRLFRAKLADPHSAVAMAMRAAPFACRALAHLAAAQSQGIDDDALDLAMQKLRPHLGTILSMADALDADGRAQTTDDDDDDDDAGDAAADLARPYPVDHDPQDRDQRGPSAPTYPVGGDPGTPADAQPQDLEYRRSEFAKQRSDGSFYRELEVATPLPPVVQDL